MRIRTIKPEFFLHDALFEAEKETALPLRLSYIGLWCACDRAGRFKWEPRRLGVSILPYDCIDFSRVLHALTTRGFVVKYRVNKEDFGAVPSFSRHQVINNRESHSILPDYSVIGAEIDACPTRGARVPHADSGEGKGMEGNGREWKGKEGEIARVVDASPTPFELSVHCDSSKKSKKQKQTPEQFIESLKLNPAYKHINIEIELGKMDAWISTRPGKQKTSRFVVAWLNRIEDPLPAQTKPQINTSKLKGGVL